MEDLILVSGRTLVSSWAAVAFQAVDNAQEAEISLAVGAYIGLITCEEGTGS